MKQHRFALLALALAAQALLSAGAIAQGIQAQASQGRAAQGARVGSGADEGHPDGVSFAQSNLGPVYVDAHGMTLYALNMRYAAPRTQDFNGLKYCTGPCAQNWIPLASIPEAKPLGQWRVVDGARGPQWAYRGDPVFTYVGDKAPGSTAGDGYDDGWTAMRYIPPVPKVVGPANVMPLFADGAYLLVDRQGHALYSGTCASDCDNWSPFLAGMAAQGVGDWTVSHDGDRAQWMLHGRPVYVSQEDVPTQVPANTSAIRP
jgi:predicted lipoprotein with Yx(FWY)xxD motif